MNAIFIRLITRGTQTFLYATPCGSQGTVFPGVSNTEYEVTDKTKFFFNNKECKLEVLKHGNKLVINGKPALTIHANDYTRPQQA